MTFERRVTVYSFVLTCFVIWLHAGESLLSTIPGQIAVPGFFLMSGYLFFRNLPQDKLCETPCEAPVVPCSVPSPVAVRLAAKCARIWHASQSTGAGEVSPGTEQGTARTGETAARSMLLRKLRTRVRTLLIPYLLWNTIYFVIYLLFGKAAIEEAPRAIFLYSCNPVFWYLWQLLRITVLTPLLLLLLRKKAAGTVVLLAVFLLAVWNGSLPFHYCNEDALFYYAFGAFAALHRKDGIEKKETASKGTPAAHLLKKQIAAAAGLFLLAGVLERVLPAPYGIAGTVGLRASGAVLLWFLLEAFSGPVREEKNGLPLWMRQNFFVYATHYMVIRAVWALESAMGLNGSAFANICTYLCMPAFCIAAAAGLAVILKKCTPRVYTILTGGR